MTLLDPRVWIAALLIAVAGFGLGYVKGNTNGKAKVQAKWDADTAEREKAQMLSKQKLEDEYANRVQTAIAERDAQIKRVQADADRSRAAACSLRQQLAASRGRIASAPATAVADYASAVTDVLGECTAEYQRVAAAADGHAADAAALMRAWPGQSFGASVKAD